jgi:hypothetical protein
VEQGEIREFGYSIPQQDIPGLYMAVDEREGVTGVKRIQSVRDVAKVLEQFHDRNANESGMLTCLQAIQECGFLTWVHELSR